MTLKLNGSSSGSVSIDAPASTTGGADVTFKLPVADGTAGQVLQTDGSGNLSWVTPGGITEIDQWAVTGDVSSDADPITSWARQNNTTFSSNPNLGTGMSHSSGVFTFPSTGYWLIMWAGGVYMGSGDGGVGVNLSTTNDNGSNWATFSNIDDGSGSGGAHGHMTDQAMLDITNVSNQKVKFVLSSVGGSSKLKGSTTKHMSNAMFIRLGDT